MFGNFIYFILVLLIYLTYQPSEETNFTASESFMLFLSLVFVFIFFTRFQFQRIERRIANGEYLRIDHRFNTTLVDLSQKLETYDLIRADVERVNESLPPPARVRKFLGRMLELPEYVDAG